MTYKSRPIATAAVLLLISFAALAVLPHLAAVLSPQAAAMLTDPNTATVALAMAAEPLAYTIREFCRAHGISVPTYYDLKQQGLGPAEMRMGTVIRISRESAAAWRRARENPSEAEAEASSQVADALRDRARRAAKRAIESPRHVSRRVSNQK
jgi:hypothetical protein